VPTFARVSTLVLWWSLGGSAPFGCGGHDHGEEAEDPRPGLAFTRYEDGLELFMETPAFVVGQESPLVAHFTDARDPEAFRWVTEGKVSATVRYRDGTEEVFSVDHLLRNGIFKPIVQPTRAGPAELVLRLEGPVSGTVRVGPITVFASVEDAMESPAEEEPAEAVVGYLKESQWKTVYATALAEQATLRGSVRATGELVAPIGARAALDSPTTGRVEGTPLLRVGAEVRAGDVLARVVPLGSDDRGAVDADVAAAAAELALAESALKRAESLYPAVVSEREVQAARSAFSVAGTRLQAVQGRRRAWSGGGAGGAELRSPITGRVAFVHADPGGVVDVGAPVVEVVDAARLWLEARVFESDAPRVRGTSGAMFAVAGRAEPVVVDAAHGGAVLAVGPAVDPIDRTVPVVFELPNPGDLLPGTYADVRVFTAESVDAVAVPAAAVVDDGGFPVVFVMDGGESFFKRRVTVGVRDGDRIAVTSGVAPGERVVSRGAYEVLLSTSAGGIPAHGHQH
jgi:membrane fusion protein, heavy metal efflux system